MANIPTILIVIRASIPVITIRRHTRPPEHRGSQVPPDETRIVQHQSEHEAERDADQNP